MKVFVARVHRPHTIDLLPGIRPAAALHRVLDRWSERIRSRRQMRNLAKLDDTLLDDLGFTRSQLVHEGSKPFWR